MEIIKLDTMRGKKVTVARIRMNIDLLSSLILHSGTPSIDTFDKLRVQDVDYAVIEPLREDIKGFLHKISKLDSLSEIEINKLARVANSLLEKKVVIIDLKGMKIGAARKFTTNLIMQKVKYSRCKIFKRNDFLMLFNFVEYTKDLLIEVRNENKHSLLEETTAYTLLKVAKYESGIGLLKLEKAIFGQEISIAERVS